jgi:perosamine synthetase
MTTGATMTKKIPITQPSITELEISYVNDAIRNGWGEKCYDYIYLFEKKFAAYQHTQYSLATSSCTGAIHLALMALGVKAGDEVIAPETTWIATVEPILYIGAKPVFVDVLPDTWCIDPKKIEAAITPKTKAIIVVHLYGNVCEMDEIMAIAKKYNLLVLEDAAEGLGSEYKGKKCGSIGDAGVFSFHGTKTMTTGEGGILVTKHESVYEKAKILNDHGRNPKDPENKMFWMRDYGYKYKISNLQAALGVAQIERIEELVAQKRQIFDWYKALLTDLPCCLNPEQEYAKNSYWMPTALIHKEVGFDRDAFFTHCKSQNIDSRPFFFPLSSLPMFEEQRQNTVSYDIYDRAVNLPSYHAITLEEVRTVVNCLKKFIVK